MNIFMRELRANFKSLLIWSAITILFSMVGFSKFSAFYQNPDLLVVLDSMPPSLLQALNMNAFNLTSVTGFFGIMVIYFSLILTISAAMWGSDIISKEERDKTVEFSLTLPVPRAKLVSAKFAAAAVNCALLWLVTWGITLVGAQNYQPDATFYDFVAVSMRSFALLQLIFLSLGILLGCAMKQHKRAGSLAVSILLVSYFISIIIGLDEHLQFLRYVTPFKYFDAAGLLRNMSLDPTYVILSIAITLIFTAGAYFAYQKRDMYI